MSNPTDTINRLYETYAETVIIPKGARHIDNGNGYTACGIACPEGSVYFPRTPLDRPRQAISCGYCATGTKYPQEVK